MKKNVTIEVHLQSTDLLLTVQVDSRNRIKSFSTTYLPGKTDANGTDLAKPQEPESDKEKISPNREARISSRSVPNADLTQQIITAESTGNGSVWFEKAYNGFSSAMMSLMKWLYIGIQWSSDINQDAFARRTVTRYDPIHCSADRFGNHSLVNLDLDSGAINVNTSTRPVSFVPLTTLGERDISRRPDQKSPDNNLTSEFQTGNETADEKGNEGIKGHDSVVVFIEPYGNVFDDWPELLPEFELVDSYRGFYPEILSALPVQSQKNEACPGSEDSYRPKQDGDLNHSWSDSPPEFVAVGYFGLPSRNAEYHVDGSDDIDVMTETPGFSLAATPTNETCNQVEAICPKQLAGTCYWIQEDGDGIHGPPPEMDEPLKRGIINKGVARKIGKDVWFAKIALNESVVCPVGLHEHNPETEFCATKDAKPLSHSTWQIRNSCWAYFQWRKSKDVSIQTTTQDNRVMKKVAPTNESLFCPRNSGQRSPRSAPWFTIVMRNKSVDITRWIASLETPKSAYNFTYYYWIRFKATMSNWTWQNTFDVMITIWFTDFCFMALYVTIGYIKGNIRLRREFREREVEGAEEEEPEQQLSEEDLELSREQAAKSKRWRSKPPKKKKQNASNKKQNWK